MLIVWPAVNPATSFSNSIWSMMGPILPQIPTEAYKALPIALAPVLGAITFLF